jgi:hypothetical protein
MKTIIRLLMVAALFSVGCSASVAALMNRFDVVTFCCGCPVENRLCEPQFDALNWPAANGHYLAMGSDAYRAQIVAHGNGLAIYYNVFNDGCAKMTAAEKAAVIEKYAQTLFAKTGPRPQWIILNEISAGLWPTNAAYRQWAVNVVATLKNKYKFSVILCAPFARPGAHSNDWQAVAANANIGIECYLSGKAIKAHGFSTNWCETQYRISKEKYLRLGVPADRLFLAEDFSNTEDVPKCTWGRAGVSREDWNRTIAVRSTAIHEVGFAGFMSYAWSKNKLKAPADDLIQFEKTYKNQTLP